VKPSGNPQSAIRNLQFLFKLFPFHRAEQPYSARPSFPTKSLFMSQHRSLKGQSTIAAKRNVLKRFERVEVLKSRGLFKPGDKVIGLRKTKPNA
jgi:small basic protein (TIGR04137 family)